MNHPRSEEQQHSMCSTNTSMMDENTAHLPLLHDHGATTAAKPKKQQKSSSSSSPSSVLPYPFQAIPTMYGAAFGFIIQTIAIYFGALSLLMIQQESEEEDDAKISTSLLLLLLLVNILSRIDKIVYAIIWIIFTWLQFQSSSSSSRQCSSWRCKRIFNIGINGLVGLVIGSFVSSLLILNQVAYFPVPPQRFIYTLLLDLILCYFMAIWNDWEDDEDDDDASNDSTMMTTTIKNLKLITTAAGEDDGKEDKNETAKNKDNQFGALLLLV